MESLEIAIETVLERASKLDRKTYDEKYQFLMINIHDYVYMRLDLLATLDQKYSLDLLDVLDQKERWETYVCTPHAFRDAEFQYKNRYPHDFKNKTLQDIKEHFVFCYRVCRDAVLYRTPFLYAEDIELNQNCGSPYRTLKTNFASGKGKDAMKKIEDIISEIQTEIYQMQITKLRSNNEKQLYTTRSNLSHAQCQM